MSRLPALLVGVLFTVGVGTACETTGGSSGCRPAAAAAAIELAPNPQPKKTAARPPVCTKATSPVWKGFKPYRGDIKTNGEKGNKLASISGTTHMATSRSSTATAGTSAPWTRPPAR